MDTSAAANASLDTSTQLFTEAGATEPPTEFVANDASPPTGPSSTSASASSLAKTPSAPGNASIGDFQARPSDIAASVKAPRCSAYVIVRMSEILSRVLATTDRLPNLTYLEYNVYDEARSGPFSRLQEFKPRYSAPTSTILRLSLPSTCPDKPSNDDLRSRLESLPTELYIEIENLTFAFDFSLEGRCIDRENYKPPMQLQIHRALRARFIPLYYGSDEPWVFVSRSRNDFQCAEVQPWLDSLSPKALAAVHGPWPGHVPVERHITGLYILDGNISTIRAATWQKICTRRPGPGNASSCWAWSPLPDEYGRWATHFVRRGKAQGHLADLLHTRETLGQ